MAFSALEYANFTVILIKKNDRILSMAEIPITEGVVDAAQSYFYTVMVGIIILLVGFGLGLLLKKIVHRILQEFELNKIMSKIGITANVERGVSWIVSSIIYLITILFFLNQLGITSVVLYLIVGAILMLLVLTFLVGLKDVIPNLVAWIILQKKGNVKEGKRIELREIYGVVERVGYLETEIRTDRGDVLYVPNALFLKSKVTLKK